VAVPKLASPEVTLEKLANETKLEVVDWFTLYCKCNLWSWLVSGNLQLLTFTVWWLYAYYFFRLLWL